MSIEEARDALERTCDDALGGLGIQLARRINDLIDAKLSPAPVGEEAEPTMQYYYRVSGCTASNPTQSECICWHDQGAGPVPDAVAGAPRDTHVWREKPIPTPPTKDTEGEELTFGYTNWRGEYSLRRVRPIRLYYGNSDWHEGFQWFLRAFDLDKEAERDFALCAIVPEPTTRRIADLEARLAEAKTEIADLTHDLTKAFDEKGAAERALADATKRIEALEEGLKPTIRTKHDKEMDAFLADVEGVIEATSCEQHYLWEDWHQREKMPWEQFPSGLLEEVGQFGEMPVCVSLHKVRIEGHVVLFYHDTSLVVHNDIVRGWLDEHVPAKARHKDGRIVHADAMNAFNVMHELRRRRALFSPASEGKTDG